MKDPALKKRRKRQFESLDVETIKLIQHADALAVWTLLMAMPDDWHVNRLWLRRQLGIGKARLNHAVGRLKDLGLWLVKSTRDESGRMTGSEVWLADEIDRGAGFPASRKSDQPEIRPLLSTNPTQDKNDDSRRGSVVEWGELKNLDIHPDRFERIGRSLQRAAAEQRRRFYDLVEHRGSKARNLGRWAEALARMAANGKLDPIEEAEIERAREEEKRKDEERKEEEEKLLQAEALTAAELKALRPSFVRKALEGAGRR